MEELSETIKRLKAQHGYQDTATTAVLPVDEQEPEPANIVATLPILQQVRLLTQQWADACLRLAASVDWQPVEYRKGFTVRGGQFGWRMFITESNLAVLRDQVYPALVKVIDSTKPPEP
tara:strand:- start:107 stop:463 length:357 start_codon:yes stop_codon:yes gene_type:complete